MLQHPCVIQYFDSFQFDSAMMIVMEYAPGGNLYSFLQSRQPHNLLQEEVKWIFNARDEPIQSIIGDVSKKKCIFKILVII